METQLVKEQSFFLTSSSQERFFVRSYAPAEEKPKGIIQVFHGMAEHSGRYEEFGRFLAQNGYALFVNDHPGHGQTAGSMDRLGYLPNKNGWEIMLENCRALYTHIKKNMADVPLYILGHSMGSILARHFTAIYPVYIQGICLSGTFEMPNSMLRALKFFVSLQAFVLGSNKKSRWFNKVFFQNFNRHFKPRPTPYEWISSSREEADAYANDPYCGFDCSISFYKNLARGVINMKKANANIKYRKTLPFLIVCGQEDPVGNFGKDAIKIHHDLYKQKFQNLQVKVFKGRHEMLHETEKEKVFDYLLTWMKDHLHTK